MEVRFTIVGLMPEEEHDLREIGQPWPTIVMDVPRAEDYVTFPRRSGGETMLRVRSVTFFPLGDSGDPAEARRPHAYVVLGRK